ncbi:hypothetical protein BSKO_10401 [Bryopsis sp. KO-2023]|nr:hypothetical protein BSKO_10401 [Bryopsis sp. KO-2023]
MGAELDALGGGDARIGHAGVCVVSSHPLENERTILSLKKGRIHVTDPETPEGLAESVRRYPITNLIGDGENAESVFENIGKEPLEWLIEGFNATILTMGKSNTGKSITLFGHGLTSASQPGLVVTIVKKLLKSIGNGSPQGEGQNEVPETHCLGLSVWEVLQDTPKDLLAPDGKDSTQKGTWPATLPLVSAEFACVQVKSMAEVLSVIGEGKQRSSNWGWDELSQDWICLPGEAHVFVRIVLFNRETGVISALHIVDLIGSRSLSSQGPAAAFDQIDSLGAEARGRRLVSRQLLALNKIISDLAQKENKRAVDCVVSGREFRLTRLLAPLIAGNCRTFVLALVSGDPDDYLDTINTLRIATRAQTIKTACMRTVCGGDGLPLVSMATLTNWKELMEKTECPSGRPNIEDAGKTPHHRGQVAEFKNRLLQQPASDPRLLKDRRMDDFLKGDSLAPSEVDTENRRGTGPMMTGSNENQWNGRTEHMAGDVTPNLPRGSDNVHQEFQAIYSTPLNESQGTVRSLASFTPLGSTPLNTRIENHAMFPPRKAEAPRVSLADVSKFPFGDSHPQADDGVPKHDGNDQADHTSGYFEVGFGNCDGRASPGCSFPMGSNENPLFVNHESAGSRGHVRMLEVAKKEIKEAKEDNETLLTLLDREKRNSDNLGQRLKDMENEMLEAATKYEVELDNVKISKVALKTRCRQLESETMFAEVFDRFEEQIEKLSKESEKLKQENDGLAGKLAFLEMTSGGKSRNFHDHERSIDDGPRVQLLRKQLRRSELEKTAIKKENSALKRKERLFDLHKKQAVLGTQRSHSYQKKLAEKEKEVVNLQLKVAEVEAQKQELDAQIQRLRLSKIDGENERDRMRDSLEKVQRQISLANMPQNKTTITSASWASRMGAGLGKEQKDAERRLIGSMELCQKLRRELGRNAKAECILEQVIHQIQGLQCDWNVMRQREAALMDMALTPDSKERKA